MKKYSRRSKRESGGVLPRVAESAKQEREKSRWPCRMLKADFVGKKSASSLFIAVALVSVLGISWNSNSLYSFNFAAARMELWQQYSASTSSAKESSTRKGLLDEHSCKAKLDALDVKFDAQRLGRNSHPAQNKDSRTLFDLYEPEAVCFSEERFGSKQRFQAFHDGPKFVCGVDLIAKKDNCLVYSIGSNNDIQFEVAVYEHLGCETHTFDPTLKKVFIGGGYSTFHPWGLGEDGAEVSVKESSFTAMSLEHITRELGHKEKEIDILKIDCEGCEYTSLPPFFESMAEGKVKVNQIQLEIHLQGNDSNLNSRRIQNLFDAADRAGMRIFHKERNQWGCKGYNCVEYAFVSKPFLREANAGVICNDDAIWSNSKEV